MIRIGSGSGTAALQWGLIGSARMQVRAAFVLGLWLVAHPGLKAFAEDIPGFSEGAWTFMFEPGASAADIETSCRSSFTEVTPDNKAVSFAVEPLPSPDPKTAKVARLKPVFRETCPAKITDGVTCVGTDLTGAEARPMTSSYFFSKKNGEFALIIRSAGSKPVTTFPKRCPDSVVEDVRASSIAG